MFCSPDSIIYSVAEVALAWPVLFAVFNPKMYISIHRRHPYTGNLKSETPGDSKSAFLHCGGVLALSRVDSVQHDAMQLVLTRASSLLGGLRHTGRLTQRQLHLTLLFCNASCEPAS